MALTFDDGPWTRHTADVLDILGRHGVRSTFFMVGERVSASPSMARRVWEEGHEIGMHTQHHLALSKVSPAKQNQEISQNWEAIQLAVPQASIYWWRAPYGDVPKPTPSAVAELGLHHKAWSIDTNDWRGVSDVEFQGAIFDRARDGAVVLMHEHTPVTRRNLEVVIVSLQEAGYQLVTVSELKLPACGTSPHPDSEPVSPSVSRPPVGEPLETPPLQAVPGSNLEPAAPSVPIEAVPVDELPRIINY